MKFQEILLVISGFFLAMTITLNITSCDDEGNFDEDQALMFCTVIQNWISLPACQNIVAEIVADQEAASDDCPEGPTGEIEPLDDVDQWFPGMDRLTYRSPGVPSSVQCPNKYIQKQGVPVPDSTELVPFANADVGDFENFNGDLNDSSNLGIPPHYWRVQTDTTNLNDTQDEDGNIIFDDLIIYLQQGTDKYSGIPNINSKCDCSGNSALIEQFFDVGHINQITDKDSIQHYFNAVLIEEKLFNMRQEIRKRSSALDFCKKIYVEDCLSAFDGIDTFGLKGIFIN